MKAMMWLMAVCLVLVSVMPAFAEVPSAGDTNPKVLLREQVQNFVAQADKALSENNVRAMPNIRSAINDLLKTNAKSLTDGQKSKLNNEVQALTKAISAASPTKK